MKMMSSWTKKDRFTKMSKDFNELGAGMYECLGDTKSSFQTSNDLALVIDKFYNGAFAENWPEVNSQDTMKLHGIVNRYKEAWIQTHEKIRPAASAAAVERSLGQIRYFVNTSVPAIKKKVDDRNAAKLDVDSYRRRYDDMSAKSQSNPKLAPLKQKMETSDARFKALNSLIKDELIKEKIARDTIIEEATITFIVCQHQMYKELAANLGDLVDLLPEDKVLSIRKKITDTVQSGGPKVNLVDDSTAMQVAKVAVGIKGVTDYTKSAADVEREAKEEALRKEKATQLATDEQRRLGQLKGPSFSGSGGVAPPAPPFGQRKEIFKALYDCDAESAGDLAFKTGEKIEVTKKDASGWWIGSIQGQPHRQGQFPANYVELA
mmetsp:Transcript_52361/g.67145  ORF Transcript_52361/g.67145 Transcript_52361/m.67145 type:complete len:378 (+) Transcript_52361:185-1318(+)